MEYYKTYKLVTKSFANIPITDKQKKEHYFRMLRKNKLGFIEFKEPYVQGQHFDFIVNDNKIQEKVGTSAKNRKNIFFKLGKGNGKRKCKRPYKKGDNDIYWFHMPDEQTFFVIPEEILYNKGYINNTTKKRKNRYIIIL